MSEMRIHLNGFGRVVCARCLTDLKGPIASKCEVCNESLGVTGVMSLGGGGGGGGSNKPVAATGSNGRYFSTPEDRVFTCDGSGGSLHPHPYPGRLPEPK